MRQLPRRVPVGRGRGEGAAVGIMSANEFRPTDEVNFVSALSRTLAAANGCLMGLLAEVVSRTYFESKRQDAYYIREMINLKDPRHTPR